MIRTSSNSSGRIYFSVDAYNVIPQAVSKLLLSKSEIILNRSGLTIDGVNCVKPGKGLSNFTSFSKFAIFAQLSYSTGGCSRYAKAKCYGFIINEQDKSIINLVPCLDRNNNPCLYDAINKKTFYNAGTGTFLYGAIIS